MSDQVPTFAEDFSDVIVDPDDGTIYVLDSFDDLLTPEESND
jgi:hypothetical protein